MPWLRNIRRKLSSLLIKGSNCALDGVNLPFLEKRLAALAADPGWYGIERQVVSVSVDMKGCGRASHCSSAVQAFHVVFLVRRSLSHSSSEGRYAVMTAR